MIKQEFNTLHEKLDALLETERRALLSGDLGQVGKLLKDKEVLVSKLTGSESTFLIKLQEKLERNQRLLDRALAGVRNVYNRLGTLKRLRRSLETYDKTGKKSILDHAGSTSIEKHA